MEQTIQILFNLLFFITPLIMTKSTSELFEFNKILFIYSITAFISFFWLLKMVINKKIILKKTPLDIPIAIFFLSQVISTIFSLDRHVSFFGYYGRFNGGLLSTICYIVLYYAFITNKISVEKSFKAILNSSLIVILWAIPGKFGHDLTCLLFTGQFNNSCWDNTTLAFHPELRAFSTLGQPNWLGAYLAVAFFIGIYFLISKKLEVKSQNLKLKIKSLGWPTYLFLNFSMILMSRSRSAIGAVIVGLILFVVYYWFFIKTNFKKVLLILLIVTVVPILFFKTGEEKIDKYISILNIKDQILKIQIKNQKENAVKLSPLSNINNLPSLNITESFDIRKLVWQGAWQLGLKYPLFGTGVETFAYSYNFVRPAAHNLTSEWDYVYNKAHNEYLNFLATTGFVGLISYLILITSFIFYTIRISNFKFLISNQFQILKSKKQNNLTIEQYSNETILTICLLIAYSTILITNFFGFSTTTIQLFFFLIPAFIFASSDSQDEVLERSAPLRLLQKLFIFLLLAATIYLLFSIAVYYLADVNYSLGSKYAKVESQEKAASYFEKSLKLRREPVYEDRFSSTLSYLAAIAALQNQKDLSNKIVIMSETYNRQLIQAYPKNVFYWKTRAKNMFYFYQITGKENELLQGVRALRTAQKLYPTDPKISYSLALYYTTLYDTTTKSTDKQNFQALSLEEIENTIQLKSNYREAYLFKGQLLKKYGQTDEAKKVFEYMLENFDAKDSEVLKELDK